MKKLFLVFSFTIPLSIFGQGNGDSAAKPVTWPSGYTAHLNTVYTNTLNWEGKMDIYLPPIKNQSAPVIINIHGGGWNHGEKETQGGFSTFFKEGFAVANIEYRLTAQASSPAAIQDTRCALIYLINHANELNIDVDKIIIIGGSAGGHLALMGGLLENNPIFDNNCSTLKKIKVAAIIDKWGIADVWDWGYGKNITSKSAISWLGEKKLDSVFAASVSPNHYVSMSSPPTLIIHGDADPTVPYQQSVLLYKQFQTVGVKSDFISVPGGLHGKFSKEQTIDVNKAILKFILEVIRK